MPYSLRPAQDSDKAWLDELRRAAYEELFDATWGGWDEERHRRHFAASWQRGNIKVVEVDGHPIGMIQLLESGDRAELAEIQIAPESQGTGIGTQLLVDIIARAKNEGRDVVLSTGADLELTVPSARGFRRSLPVAVSSLSRPASPTSSNALGLPLGSAQTLRRTFPHSRADGSGGGPGACPACGGGRAVVHCKT